MSQMKVPPAPPVKTTVYGNFRGVDFSVDPSLVDQRRSPYAPNMISDNGGNPVKRPGWRVLHTLAGNINGLFFVELGGKSFLLAHAGTTLSKIEGETVTELKTGISDTRSTSFFMNDGKDKRFLLTGDEFLSYDGETVKDAMEDAYIPTVIISRNPTGGGTVYEAVNLIQPKRTDSFLGTADAKEYQLSSTQIDATPLVAKIANSKGGEDEMKEGSGFTVNRETGKVTFSATHAPVVAGQDNIKITYAKTVEGYADKIKKCTVCTAYGVGGSNRVFLTGNPKFKSYDFWSEIFRPSYYPDLNYAVIGSADTAIIGYQKLGEYLSIIKEDSQQDTTIFLRSGTMDEKGKVQFSTKASVAGIGAISPHCFVNLGDEPLFLSRRGVYAVTSTLLSYERITKNRSFFVDSKLTQEKELGNAVACEWNGYYVLVVNGHGYLLDSRHKSGDKAGNSDYLYECYYWENIPATCLLSVEGTLYFGTEDGRVCQFNTDSEEHPNMKMTVYSDGGTLSGEGRVEGGTAIDAAWFTSNDDDGCVQFFKTLQKKGSLVTLSPYDRSSAEVCFLVDGNPEEVVRKEEMDIFDWEDIDFERFTFNSNTSPQEIYIKKKRKKYKRLQIGIRNRQINEGFGIHQIVKSYVIGGYSKVRGL